ncbi:GDP-mannose 4,6-dehydratase [Hymenobacter koreensis]|uniref:GDP-mannose 4,6-dehydratase n=1 Tax=Hymenobacter koreensis TaxID=1084523 RepID=A0ABP8J7X0_9BACT
MHTVLVTGCAGFIGSHLCERLLADGFRVLGLDNFDPFYPRALKEQNLSAVRKHPQFNFQELDLRSGVRALDAAWPHETPDLVVHLAAKAGVGPSVHEPLAYLDNNVLGTGHLLEWMRQRPVSRLLFASSSSVYGNTRRLPFQETEPLQLACISPYATTKLAGEELTFTYHHLYRLNVLNARFFTVYGPRQRPDLAIHKFVRLLQAGQTIPVFGDGTTARDYTYVADIIDGIVRGVKYLLVNEQVYETVNLGNNKPVPLLQLIEAVAEAVGVPARLRFEPMQAGDVDITFADISKAQRLLGYAPRTPLSEGLQAFVKWLKVSEQTPALK